MIRNERVCDLCACAVPNDPPHIDRFSTLTVVGGAQQAVQSAFGRNAGIDLCGACAESVVRLLVAGKAGHAAKASGGTVLPAPAPEATHEAAPAAPGTAETPGAPPAPRA